MRNVDIIDHANALLDARQAQTAVDLIVDAAKRGNGDVDERSRHAGLSVTRGEKWICTRWIRARDFDPWGMRPAKT